MLHGGEVAARWKGGRKNAEVTAKERFHAGMRPCCVTGALPEERRGYRRIAEVAANAEVAAKGERYHAGVRPSGGTGVLLENGEAAIESTYGYRSKLFIGKGVVAKE